jgi:tellurite methyltransferase
MRRPIVDFRRDAAGDWVAVLDCGHPQHVRHRPPFEERPWVTTAAGRREKVGLPLDCVRCDRRELPADAAAYKRTPDFTETTMPDALRREHTTRPGVWGRIVVAEGRLRYRVDDLATDVEVVPGSPAIVVPEVPHHVEPLGPVRFFVEFLRVPSRSDAATE